MRFALHKLDSVINVFSYLFQLLFLQLHLIIIQLYCCILNTENSPSCPEPDISTAADQAAVKTGVDEKWLPEVNSKWFSVTPCTKYSMSKSNTQIVFKSHMDIHGPRFSVMHNKSKKLTRQTAKNIIKHTDAPQRMKPSYFQHSISFPWCHPQAKILTCM